MAQFPTLYGEASTGKRKVWSIRVFEQDTNGIIETTHGYEDCKMQSNIRTVSSGKNIGKKNATTALQQAIAEANTAWVKKRENGYKETKEDAETNAETNAETDAETKEETNAEEKKEKGKGINENVPCPMLAHDYSKRGKDIVFPCFVQPKLDGTRCVAFQHQLFSRNRKSYPHLEHIVQELSMLHPSIILDGELYSTELTFQEIVGLVKRETLKEGDVEKQKKIKFHVYDMIDATPFENRFLNLQLLFKKHKFKYIVLVKTEICDSDSNKNINEKHAAYVSEGYEGLMLRNTHGLYSHGRSKDLQKYKEFEDGEYAIIGYEQGQGLEDGCVIWICKTDSDKTFHVRPRGSREERQRLFQNGESYIGKCLTVRFQELTSDGIPRFPVGITIRDYE